MQYKEKKNMQVMHFEEMCRFYYFILKEKKMYASLCALYVFS